MRRRERGTARRSGGLSAGPFYPSPRRASPTLEGRRATLRRTRRTSGARNTSGPTGEGANRQESTSPMPPMLGRGCRACTYQHGAPFPHTQISSLPASFALLSARVRLGDSPAAAWVHPCRGAPEGATSFPSTQVADELVARRGKVVAASGVVWQPLGTPTWVSHRPDHHLPRPDALTVTADSPVVGVLDGVPAGGISPGTARQVSSDV